MDPNVVVSPALKVCWDPASRIASLTCAQGATLSGEDGALFVEALARWSRDDPAPFAVIGDAAGLRTTHASYRLETRPFFAGERERVFVAVINMNPVIRVIAEMFRIGTRIQLKGFAHEAEARTWLRQNGIRA